MKNTWKIILLIVIIIIIVVVLWWGFWQNNTASAPTTATSTTQTSAVAYACPSGKNVSASFSQTGDSVDLQLADGSTVTLNRTKSADGGRYANADESVVFWDKGNQAMLTQDGTTETCTNQAAAQQVNANETAVKQTVEDFGKQLQKVSLLAPDASSTMKDAYGPYVTGTLLAEWQKDPSKAPGRDVSSPWPDHIEITDVSTSGVVYSVEGKIVLMTSNEVEHGGNAGTVDVSMTLVDQNGKWLINTLDEGSKNAPEAATGTAS
ncbi:MAG TPA: MliC family protein [Candidatus Paceibacterota bacterium]|nr:MliC family protein [Candidatus Paceibacterota bacterium]